MPRSDFFHIKGDFDIAKGSQGGCDEWTHPSFSQRDQLVQGVVKNDKVEKKITGKEK